MPVIYDSSKLTIISNNTIVINGKELPNCPGIGSNITIIGDKVFKNGYEYDWDAKKWKKTLRALWHKWF